MRSAPDVDPAKGPSCPHTEALEALAHDRLEHASYGTCEACEFTKPARCSCGYQACCGFDADEHEAAVRHLAERHEFG